MPSSSSARRLVVVGIGADGLPGLGASSRAALSDAEALVGARRQLDLVPESAGQQRHAWPSPMAYDLLDDLLGAGLRVAVLASGDPMVSGVGSTLVDRYGAERVDVRPAVSSVALARARMGWPAERTDVLSLVARPVARLLRLLAPGARLLLLSGDERTPAEVAALLAEVGYGASRLTVLGELGGAGESRLEATAADAAVDWDRPADHPAAHPAAHPVPRLNVLAVACVGPPSLAWTPGLPDESYDHDGQLTKRDQRASALSRLAPQPGELLWDVGAGAGSVGIEWMRTHPACRTVAVEADPERARRIRVNADRLGVPDLQVVVGRARDLLGDAAADQAGLPDPDACFVGGGVDQVVLDHCRRRLRPGGRLVAHAVTLETERLLLDAHAAHGGELVRLGVERCEPLGRFRGWTPARAIVQWTWVGGGGS